ncbi:MAG: glycine cleavage system aminomethyltransferase GcvT [Candidatus Omnitrophica bacterium]|nr:glycine cleavage system aminomethyltransferase GcvT [Candidatus Omnitrophota bacterium]
MQASLYRTPLYQAHCDLGARMVDFGGWLMPVQYEGILSEYSRCREQAALFDISHMGEFIFDGNPVSDGLEKIITCEVSSMPIGSSRYGLMLNDRAGVVDDLIVFRISEKRFMIVVNAANIAKDFSHLKNNLLAPSLITDISEKTAKLDLQGPLSREVLKNIIPGVESLDYFHFNCFDILGEKNIVSRTGYTGELGYEIFCAPEKAQALWKKLLDDERVRPAGLGARDILRTEMAYSLYGHEITDDISPLDAGLSRFICFDKEFIGKDTLLQQKQSGLKRKIIYFLSDTRRSPRHGQSLYENDSKEIGIVTSGIFSPSLEKGIGIGLISVDSELDGDKIFFGDKKNKSSAAIVKRPFYKKGSLKT